MNLLDKFCPGCRAIYLEHLAEVGRAGGKVASEKKKEAVRENGKKGGRPKK